MFKRQLNDMSSFIVARMRMWYNKATAVKTSVHKKPKRLQQNLFLMNTDVLNGE